MISAFEKWQAWAEEKACCDFAFKLKLSGDDIDDTVRDEIRELSMENNINCFLASMADYNDEDLIEFFQACTSTGNSCHEITRITTRAHPFLHLLTYFLEDNVVQIPMSFFSFNF